MAIENVKSALVQNFEGRPGSFARLSELGGRLKEAVDTVSVGETAGSAGSTYRCCPLPSHAKIRWASVRGVGAVDCPDVNVGAVGADGRFLDADGFVAGLAVDDPGDHVFAGSDGDFDETRELWRYSAATEDPGGIVYLQLSLAADAAALGDMKVLVRYIVD